MQVMGRLSRRASAAWRWSRRWSRGRERVSEDGLTISAVGPRSPPAVGRWSRLRRRPLEAKPIEVLPVDIISATEFSQIIDRGMKNAPKPRSRKPLVEKIGEREAGRGRQVPKVSRQERDRSRATIEASRRRRRSRSDAEAKPSRKKKPRAEARSDRRGAEEGRAKKPAKAEARSRRRRSRRSRSRRPNSTQQVAALLDKREPQRQAADRRDAQAAARPRHAERQRAASCRRARSTPCERG